MKHELPLLPDIFKNPFYAYESDFDNDDGRVDPSYPKVLSPYVFDIGFYSVNLFLSANC